MGIAGNSITVKGNWINRVLLIITSASLTVFVLCLFSLEYLDILGLFKIFGIDLSRFVTGLRTMLSWKLFIVSAVLTAVSILIWAIRTRTMTDEDEARSIREPRWFKGILVLVPIVTIAVFTAIVFAG